MISNKNDEIIKASANTINENYYQSNSINKNDTNIMNNDDKFD